jgi:two-component system chemotaxis response regulator CheB
VVLSSPAPVTAERAPPGGRYRVMVVDDSAVIRGLVARWLGADPAIEVVATMPNGLQAVKQVRRAEAEIVVLDIEMPEMDGIEAIPRLLAEVPDLKIVMSSTLTRRGAEISLKALSLGAADYVAKPESTREANTAEVFRRELIEKIKALGAAHRAHMRAQGRVPAPRLETPSATSIPRVREPIPNPKAPVVLRKPGRVKPAVLAIGSSTGGPQALFKLLGLLKGAVNVPVLVTQHMPATFTAILADHLTRATDMKAAEGKDGEPLVAGRIYVAPGDWHMTVASDGAHKVIRLDQNPPENFCRPAVDPMFRSLAAAYGPAVLALVLTGMGQDGLKGGRVLTEAGATLLGQDEASSVVWGMPGAVAAAGLCSAVESIEDLARSTSRLLTSGSLA